MANAMLGQASGGFTESSSALRILHLGIRNTTTVLTDDAFTQTNPPVVTTTSTISTQVNTTIHGVLSGSVAFSRPDQGTNYVGGNVESLADALQETYVRPLGLFINDAAGAPYQNTPAAASGKGPYVCGQGTYGSQLFETQALAALTGLLIGAELTYINGMELIASRNGYLMPRSTINTAGSAVVSLDDATTAAEREHGLSASTTLGILKMPADSSMGEIVFDLRV